MDAIFQTGFCEAGYVWGTFSNPLPDPTSYCDEQSGSSIGLLSHRCSSFRLSPRTGRTYRLCARLWLSTPRLYCPVPVTTF